VSWTGVSWKVLRCQILAVLWRSAKALMEEMLSCVN